MEKSNQLANSLINDFGIQKGDKVAFSVRNYPNGCLLILHNINWS